MGPPKVTFVDQPGTHTRRNNALTTHFPEETGRLEQQQGQQRLLGMKKKDTSESKLPICERTWFNGMMGGIIVINALLIGVQTDAENPDHIVFEASNIMFIFIYTAELATRIYYNRGEFFNSSFNIFDCVLVIKAILETFILADSALKSLTSLRLVRMIRLIRLVRLLRFFRELWLVITGVMKMLKTLAWVTILLLSLTWICAILLRMVLGQSQAWSFVSRTTAQPYEFFDPYEYFGTPWAGSFTLFQVTTKDHWMDSVARPVCETYPIMWLFFLPYLFMTAYAILNIMLATIVNNAIDASKANDAQLKLQKSRTHAKVMLKLRRIFEEIDIDESGSLDKDELQEAAENPKIISLLAEINMPVKDLARVFESLDADGDGEVDRDEFLKGCAKLRGGPSLRDVNRIPLLIRSLSSRIDWYEKRADALIDEVYALLEYKMHEAGLTSNFLHHRAGAADRINGIDASELEALRKQALRRGIGKHENEFGVNLNEVRIDREHIPFSLPLGSENLLRALPSMRAPQGTSRKQLRSARTDGENAAEPCVAHLPILPPASRSAGTISMREAQKSFEDFR